LAGEPAPRFRRGDANNNGDMRPDISDAVYILGYLFFGSPAPAIMGECAGSSCR